MGAAAQGADGEHRRQHRVGRAQHADHCQEDEQVADGRRLHDVVPAFAQLDQDVALDAGPVIGREAHRQQAPDDRDVAHAVDQEAVAFAHGGHHRAGNRRAHQARGVEVRRVERDGVAEIGAVVDHAHDEGLAGGDLDRADDALEQRQADDPLDVDVPAQRERRHGQRLHHRQPLGRDQHLAAIPAIEPHPGDGRQHERGRHAGEAHQAEQELRIRQAVDQPRRGQPRHPRADERDALADEEQTVVARAERAKR